MSDVIRLAKEDDVQAIAIIHVLSWQKTYRGLIADTILDNLSVERRIRMWSDLIKNNVKVFVIEKNNEIVGFSSICPSRDSDTDAQTCGEISTIYLHPNVWQQGLGKQLCERALIELKNSDFHDAIVWVLKENDLARKFYERMGFVLTEKIKTEKYFENTLLNEIRYRKNLSI